MNKNRKMLKITACCLAATVVFTGTPAAVYAAKAPVAGITSITSSALQGDGSSGDRDGKSQSAGGTGVGAGISQQIASSVKENETGTKVKSGTGQQETENAGTGDSAGTDSAAEPENTADEGADTENTADEGAGTENTADEGADTENMADAGTENTADAGAEPENAETEPEDSGSEAPEEKSGDVVPGIMVAGITQQIADSIADAEKEAAEKEAERKAFYENIAIAQVDNFVNVRDAATEEGEVVGKLYNNSAATVEEEEDGWYKITSGNVTGYVKSEFVVRGDEELAKEVSRRVATVDTETLFVRSEPTTESDVMGMVPDQEQLTVTDESVDGWTKVAIEEGDGYVSNEYVKMSTEFVTAESKEEEEARLAKEEAEREAAEQAAAEKAGKSSSGKAPASSPGSSSGNAVANYACQFVGNPYVYGGTSLTNGADCSGFVMSVYAAFGVGLPHSSSALRGVGYGVGDMQPGDIICYSGHVAIYIGNNTVVHASNPSGGIKYTSPANYRPILAIRRIF